MGESDIISPSGSDAGKRVFSEGGMPSYRVCRFSGQYRKIPR